MGIGGDGPTSIDFMWRSFLAGGIAGMCSKTAVAPLERIKILLQAHNKHYKNYGVFSGLKEIVMHESFFALYKGNGAQMVRIFPYAAVQFTAYEIYVKLLPKFFGNSSITNFLTGSSAGVTAVCLTYPLDTIRARLAFQVAGEHMYKGIIHAAITIFKKEGGIRALYRGFLPTVCGMIPYGGTSFYCFNRFKYLCMKYMPHITCTEQSRNTGGLALNIPCKLMCGGLAGAVAQSISYPLDVTRRRMQLAMMNSDTQKFGFLDLLAEWENTRHQPFGGNVQDFNPHLQREWNLFWAVPRYEHQLPSSNANASSFFLNLRIDETTLEPGHWNGPLRNSCGYFPSLSDSSLEFNSFPNAFHNCKYAVTKDEVDGFLAPIKYHATVLLQKYTIMNTPLKSACVKCGICLAVSEKLEQILEFALKSAVSLKDFDDYLSAQLLRPICDFAFQSYGLKEWNGLRLISQYPFLDNVPNSLEGHWWEVLKDSCHFYLTHFGEGNLVRAWLLESQNVTGLLCRNDGLFRDCRNIEQGVLTIQSPHRFLFPANYVQITYPCA